MTPSMISNIIIKNSTQIKKKKAKQKIKDKKMNKLYEKN
jgi:hypothetical protein